MGVTISLALAVFMVFEGAIQINSQSANDISGMATNPDAFLQRNPNNDRIWQLEDVGVSVVPDKSSTGIESSSSRLLSRFGAELYEIDPLPIGVGKVHTNSLQVTYDATNLGLESLSEGFEIIFYVNAVLNSRSDDLTGFFFIPGLADGIHEVIVAVQTLSPTPDLVCMGNATLRWIFGPELKVSGGSIWDPFMKRPAWIVFPCARSERGGSSPPQLEMGMIANTGTDICILHPLTGQRLFSRLQLIVVFALRGISLSSETASIVLFINGKFAMRVSSDPKTLMLPPTLKPGNYDITLEVRSPDDTAMAAATVNIDVDMPSSKRLPPSVHPFIPDEVFVPSQEQFDHGLVPVFTRPTAPPHIETTKDTVVVWTMNASPWESDWVEEVLRDVPHVTATDTTMNTFADNVLIVVSENEERNRDAHSLIAYILALRAHGARIGVVHLSDEIYSADLHFYFIVDYVIRMYWSAEIYESGLVTAGRVLTIPLGYKAGFWSGVTPSERSDVISKFPASQRKYLWNFAGQIANKVTRRMMLEEARQLGDGFEHITSRWGDAGALDTTAYRTSLMNSKVTLAPPGNANVDSFRLVEALEAGSIPIVPKDKYFETMFGANHPIPMVDRNWHDLGSLLRTMNFDETQRLLWTWWQDYKVRPTRAEQNDRRQHFVLTIR